MATVPARSIRVEGDDLEGILATLRATGASLEDGAKALLGMGAPLVRVVDVLLEASPRKGNGVMDLLGKLLWDAPQPGEAAAALAAHGVPPIRVLTSAALADEPGRMGILALALTGDMTLARAAEAHGDRVVFHHPAGAGFDRPFLAREPVHLKVNPDGSLWTPRDVTFGGFMWVFDRDSLAPRLDRFLDALRQASTGNGLKMTFSACPGLERLPDVVEIGFNGSLELQGCAKLTRLPEYLRLGASANVDLNGCFAWDGELPAGAECDPSATIDLPDGTRVYASDLKRSSVVWPTGTASDATSEQ
jgi:hypothetical protein